MPEKPKVLVVDDIALNRHAVSAHLRHAGYKVVEAASGPEAVEVLRRELPSVVIMDVMMPGMDGITAVGELRKAWEHLQQTISLPRLSVILLSADDTTETRRRAAEAGVKRFMVKPWDRGELLKAVEDCLHGSDAPEEEKKRVVIVEPDEVVRTALAHILLSEGYLVSEISSLEEFGEVEGAVHVLVAPCTHGKGRSPKEVAGDRPTVVICADKGCPGVTGAKRLAKPFTSEEVVAALQEAVVEATLAA